MRGRFATFALIAALVLAGCTGTPDRPDRPSSTAPAAPRLAHSAAATLGDPPATNPVPTSPPPVLGTEVPADVPTTGPNLRQNGERPPVMPLLATRHTPAGAVAFAKFFIQTIDWGFATTSGAYMRHYYATSCIECDNHARGLDATREAGDRYVGGRFKITRAQPVDPTQESGRPAVVVTFTITATEVLNEHGTFVDGDRAYVGERAELWLEWRHGGWTVIKMADR